MCKVDACVYEECTGVLYFIGRQYCLPFRVSIMTVIYSYGVGFCNLLVLLEGQVLRPGSWDEQVRSPTHFFIYAPDFHEKQPAFLLGCGRDAHCHFNCMEQRNFWKLLWVVAYVAFAAVSCWATAESLHLLLSSWPKVMCWIVTVGFFIIASLGTKMIVDSLNQNIYLEKRGLRLIGGIIITLVFWFVCIMPTNTHTFFYRTVIDDMVSNDISTTCNYLGQIQNNTNNKKQATLKVNELKNNVDVLLGELEAEIKNEANPGDGPKSQEIRRKLAALLGVAKIEKLSYKGVSQQDREKLCDAYRTKVYILANSRADNIMTNILSPNPDNLKEVKRDDNNLKLVRKYIDDGTIDLNKAEDINDVCDKLNNGYNSVKNNKDFVNFASESDKALYTAKTPMTKVKRMISVFEVWRDFLNGEYAGHGFLFWIIISILVDIAAFIFFDLAFKKTDY